MIKYGLISQTDARTLEKTIDLICAEFSEDSIIDITEIGVYGGGTGMGISEYVRSKDMLVWVTGIDNFKDGQPMDFPYNKFIKGNSTEVYHQLKDNSQHLIFVDGDHSKIGVIGDFYAYADKVKVNGYMVFHDTGKHIKPFKDFQHGDITNPDAYISVRKALEKIGLLSKVFFPYPNDKKDMNSLITGWELIFDEADETNEAGGVIVLKKIY